VCGHASFCRPAQLLASDAAKDRAALLQCIRFVVRNGFFDRPVGEAAAAAAAVAPAAPSTTPAAVAGL